jgi:Arc/MetJ-type ribon-helix-helix transcriptional regulator
MKPQKKSRTISVRITEEQLYQLTSALYREKQNMSEFIRESIDKYRHNCRNGRKDTKNKINDNNAPTIFKNFKNE